MSLGPDIILVSPSTLPLRRVSLAGIEAVVASLAVELARRGLEIAVVGCKSSERFPGVRLIETTSAELSKSLVRVRAQSPHSLICDHSAGAEYLGSDPLYCVVRHVEPQYVQRSCPISRTAFVSRYLRKVFADRVNQEYQFCRVIKNGVATGSQAPGVLTTGHEHTVVYIGRLNRLKGIDIAAQACRAAHVSLVIYGGIGRTFPSDTVYNDLVYLQELHNSYKDTISYRGPLEDESSKMRVLRNALCIIVPSREPESCSLVALEAASVGTPVISFGRGALHEYLGRCVYLANCGANDPEAADLLKHQLEAAISSGATRIPYLPMECEMGAMADRYIRWFDEVVRGGHLQGHRISSKC